MYFRILTLMAVASLANCSGSRGDMAGAHAVKEVQMPPARDGDIAIQEEYKTASAAGTVDAYELFIARHPEHELIESARQELDKLLGDADQVD